MRTVLKPSNDSWHSQARARARSAPAPASIPRRGGIGARSITVYRRHGFVRMQLNVGIRQHFDLPMALYRAFGISLPSPAVFVKGSVPSALRQAKQLTPIAWSARSRPPAPRQGISGRNSPAPFDSAGDATPAGPNRSRIRARTVAHSRSMLCDDQDRIVAVSRDQVVERCDLDPRHRR